MPHDPTSPLRFAFLTAWLTLASFAAHPPDQAGHHDDSHRPPDAASMRTWTNARTGEAVRGAFLAAKAGFVSIERENGDVVSFEIEALTPADREVAAAGIARVAAINASATSPPSGNPAPVPGKPPQAAPFDFFAPFVKTRWDEHWLYIESDGLPHAPADHPMMVGITAWQQQVPLPQAYTGANAWQVPLKPELADQPVSAKEQLFRGAIAIAANGIPIFNPIKNDGRTDTFLAGELDEYGGHCGRGDDYHYHIAPLALQKVLGKDKPLAYALDGFPIYGSFDPAAKKGDDKCCPLGGVEKLDWMNGHFAPPAPGAEPGAKGLYHYHATATYPYLNGGMRGKVTVKEDQIDPQPRASSPRPALPPLRGARITGFSRDDEHKKMTVTYTLGGKTHSVAYAIAADGAVTFTYTDGDGKETSETFRARERGGRGDRPPRDREGRQPRGDRGRDDRPPGDDRPPPRGDRPPGDDRPPPRDGEQRRPRRDDPPPGRPEEERPAAAAGTLRLTSSAVANGGALPPEFNGDGEGATLPLSWTGAPAGTKSYAIIMDHTDRDGVIKTYWTLYDIPADVTSLPKNVKGVGKLGATWKRGETYVTPHSAGRGTFAYTLHLYALSAPPGLAFTGGPVTRETLLAKIKDITLGSADLRVTYKRPDSGGDEPRPRDGRDGGR